MFTPQYPTNSGQTAPDLGVTVDTVVVRFDAEEELLQVLPQRRVSQLADCDTGELFDYIHGGHYAQHVGDGVVRLYASERSGRPRARVEFSVPTILKGHNAEGGNLTIISDCVDAVLSSLAWELPLIPTYKEVELVRLDLVRDFRGLSDVRATLKRVAELPVSRATRHTREYESDNALTYVRKGSGSRWKARAYDKATQLESLADRYTHRSDLLRAWSSATVGQLRYELETGRPVLKERSLMTMTSLDDTEALQALARTYFDRSRLSAVTGSGRPLQGILHKLQAEGRMADARNLIVFLACQALGEPPLLTKHTLDKARALANANGLNGDVLTADGPPRRLDFDSGRELEGDAALRVLPSAEEAV